MPMVIGFDAKRLFNNFTGLGNYSRTLVKNLQKYFPDNEYHLFTPGFQINSETEYFLDNSKFKVHSYEKPFKALWRSKGIISALKKNKIQIYHGLSNELPFGLSKTGIKSVISIHDLIFKIYPDQYTFIDRNIYDFKFRYGCKSADKIVAISNSTKNDIIKYYNISNLKIQLIYQSCDTSFSLAIDNIEVKNVKNKYQLPDRYFVSVGSIIPRKNLLTIVKAFNQINADNLGMVVVGSGGKYKSMVLDYLKKNDLEDRVTFLKSIPNHELRKIYNGAIFSIYLSLYEGFGIPVLESLKCNTPVITSNASSMAEFVHPYCFHSDPLDINGLANQIKKLINIEMPEIVDRKLLNCFSEKYSSQKLVQLYQNLIRS
jgi:glycosyltransferase involved in cell wall biosynthesis